jgi:hypothetical protein
MTQHMTIEALVDEADRGAEADAAEACRELRVRLKTLRRLVSGDRAAIDAVLDGRPLTFTQLLDKIMEEMDAAGVADIQARSIEEAENEPHRAAAHNYRAMLEERFEKLQAQGGGGSAKILDGK